MCTLRLFEGLGDDKWSLLRAVVKRNFVPAEAAQFKVSLELKPKLCKRDGVKNDNKTSLKHQNKSVAFIFLHLHFWQLSKMSLPIKIEK